jgi:hypothetical protein
MFGSELLTRFGILDSKTQADLLRAIVYRIATRQVPIVRSADDLLHLVAQIGVMPLAVQGHHLCLKLGQ